jgi:hypothetical protein
VLLGFFTHAPAHPLVDDIYSKATERRKTMGGREIAIYHWPLSRVHSIMVVKSAQAGAGGGLPSGATLWCTLQLREQISPLPLSVLCDPNCRVHIENFGELVERDVDSDSDETITNNNTEHFTKEQIPKLISAVLRIRDVSGSRIRLFSIPYLLQRI